MSTQLSGMFMEDVEVSSVEDLGSLTSQLEEALKKSGGAEEEVFEMTDEEIKRLEEEADDGCYYKTDFMSSENKCEAKDFTYRT
ncbi:unnamed protein product [Pseudo-nitzschia multistriata]|uniref:Uncharacterized protein n=1 Tax=Pseudo-nitzschia multistriata TaxID=183589 RepID=A0A448YUT9_9STRA|nr:unnamed protein product [Pseudo-nitzschia multistriata]